MELTFEADRSQLFTAGNALANLVDIAGRVTVTAKTGKPEHFQQEIPTSGGTEAEENAVLEIERKIKELDQKRRRKLDEIGYENPEDSRADLFPNGEDED